MGSAWGRCGQDGLSYLRWSTNEIVGLGLVGFIACGRMRLDASHCGCNLT